jgi:hypothetical protein
MTSHTRPFTAILLAVALALPAGGAFAQTAGYAQPGSPGYAQQQQGYDSQSGTPIQQKPKGGCLKYGAAGAVGGHFAHHHAILGALGGCAVGAYVKHRSKRAIAAAAANNQP